MDKKFWKNLKNFVYILIVVSFFVIYIASEYGYFDSIKNRKVVLTKEQISKFEEDIANGKELDIDNYYKEDDQYNNKFTKLGLFISTKIENVVTVLLDKTFKALNDFLNS